MTCDKICVCRKSPLVSDSDSNAHDPNRCQHPGGILVLDLVPLKTSNAREGATSRIPLSSSTISRLERFILRDAMVLHIDRLSLPMQSTNCAQSPRITHSNCDLFVHYYALLQHRSNFGEYVINHASFRYVVRKRGSSHHFCNTCHGEKNPRQPGHYGSRHSVTLEAASEQVVHSPNVQHCKYTSQQQSPIRSIPKVSAPSELSGGWQCASINQREILTMV